MKKMLIDDTQPEETRVVIVDGNKVEDVEFESSLRKQIKGNIFTAKVVRIEPSLQAAFVDYGGNRHGFLAFGEIHPDYYNISDEIKAEVEKEVDEIIEKKRQYQAERKAEQERRRLEREQKRAEYEARKQAEAEAATTAENAEGENADTSADEEESTTPATEMRADVANVSVSEEIAESPAEPVEAETSNDVEEEKTLDGCGCSETCACRKEDGHCHCAENGTCTCDEECHCQCHHEKADEAKTLDGCGCSETCACRKEDGHCHCAENGTCTCDEECHCQCHHEKADEAKTLDGCGCSETCACRKEDGHCHCAENGTCTCDVECHCECHHEESEKEESTAESSSETSEEVSEDTEGAENAETTESQEDQTEEKSERRPRRRSRFLGRRSNGKNNKGGYKVSAESAGLAKDEMIAEDISEEDDEEDDEEEMDNDNTVVSNENRKPRSSEDDDDDYDDDGNKDFDSDDEADLEHYLEIQRKLIYARKLYHRSAIQDVIKEGQTLLIQIVKEERGNKGAACTTYLSLAGRYCVLMPNRIKSGGVSRKITSANDRKRLKDIMRELPLNDDMSLIIRTAGEDKQKSDIVRDYNYLIRTWNHIRHSALSTPAPALIYEEGNLIKRALRDMYTKDIDEVIIDGDTAYKTAKEFSKILSPNMGRKIKCRKQGEIPVFQQYQVEKELDKLHNPVVQLASGGYLVINPTEALVSIDVNSGRATHEMDIEETALKTNLEAADEIAKQLRMRNLAGLVVVDFIDMEEPANNHAVEKRMKEAMKPDRARVQIAKMSMFGLLEISRQRMHSSFVESNYITCPYCRGQGVLRTTESSAMLVLRAIEEEGIKGTNNHLEVRLPQDTAVYILNHKRRQLADLEEKYDLEIIISADTSIKNISDYKIDKSRVQKPKAEAAATTAYAQGTEDYDDVEEDDSDDDENESYTNSEQENRRNNRRNRNDRRRRGRRNNRGRNRYNRDNNAYDDNNDDEESAAPEVSAEAPKPEKKAWWKKLLG